jgi:hypothetical protein
MKKIWFTIGVVLALIGATIMFEGNLFGERTISVAIVLGIIGLCLISTNSKHSLKNWW